jgi:hypothetical protein
MVKGAKSSKYSKYSKIYESRLMECEFLKENNVTPEDILTPIEDLITEEFIGKLISKGKDLFNKGKEAVSNIATKVKNIASKLFGGVVNFFKNFSIKKLLGGLYDMVKKLGTKVWNWLKDKFSGLTKFIMANNMVDQNNKPIFKNIWSTICGKAKGLVDWKKEGVTPQDLSNVANKVKLNEESKYDISDEEVKYYGFFEKVAHALGIKNARFNGVVSQIMKKGTIGVAIIGLMKVCGFSLAAITGGLSLGPVATAAIGGMLLMAGIIILAIWIVKPYPTLEDCLGYLHIAFSDKLVKYNLPSIFISVTNITQIVNVVNVDVDLKSEDNKIYVFGKDDAEDDKGGKSSVSTKSSYGLMISNLKSLQSLIVTISGIKIEGENISIPKQEPVKGDTEPAKQEGGSTEIMEPGQIPGEIEVVPGVLLVQLPPVKADTIDIDYEVIEPEILKITGGEEVDDKVKVKYAQLKDVWVKAQKEAGKNTKPGEGTRKRLMTLAKVKVQYDKLLGKWKTSQKEAGKNTNPGEGTRNRLMTQATDFVTGKKENRFYNFNNFTLLVEEKTFGKSRNIEITGAETYLIQAVSSIRKSVLVLKDEKDKGVGITSEFIGAILEEKNSTEAKEAVKNLYSQIYSYLYGKNKETLGDFGPLYKESVAVLQNKSKSQVVAEKIARFCKRSLQFEGENMYGGLGEFGADLKDFNKSLKQIMDSMKESKSDEYDYQGVKVPSFQKESFRYLQKFNNI